jgi:ADP-heptose:LPS heptosyltransferase
MNLNRFFRLRHFLKVIQFWISDSSYIKKGSITNEKSLLIVRTEAIGDYFHFRNFLKYIRKSEQYKNYKITLCGNVMYKDIAEKFDRDSIDDFIWINRKLFSENEKYRKETILDINSRNFHIAIQPNFSREFLIGDSIVRASAAKERIGAKGDTTNDILLFKKIADSWYTDLRNIPKVNIWEFDRNKAFFEQILNTKINIKVPSLEYPSQIKEDYIVFFPGAGEKIKQWPKENFAELATRINNKYSINIKICGSSQDYELAESISNVKNNNRIENLCGKTSLVELMDIISKCKILITNDSSAFHIGACLKTETICLFMGRHYGRFAPYPKDYDNHLHYIYPARIKNLLLNTETAIKQTKHSQPAFIEEITINQVEEEFDKIYSNL